MKRKLSELTVEEVETELIRLAKENPDFIYSPTGDGWCYYTKGSDDGPECGGCIFGQAFQNLGVPKEDLPTDQQPITTLWNFAHVDYNPRLRTWSLIQSEQDNGKSWGEAIKHITG